MAETGITRASISPRATAVNAKTAPVEKPGVYRVLCLYAVVAAAAALLTAGCRGDDGGKRGRPGELKEISAEEYEKLVGVGDAPQGPETGAGTGEGPTVKHERGGSLSGPGDKDSFELVARRDQVDVTFEWPKGEADFWVKVYGKDGGALGDFDLDQGDIIQLFGGDKFTLEIYSKDGRGAWRATYEN